MLSSVNEPRLAVGLPRRLLALEVYLQLPDLLFQHQEQSPQLGVSASTARAEIPRYCGRPPPPSPGRGGGGLGLGGGLRVNLRASGDK